MKTKFNLILTLLLAFMVQVASAQEKKISGVVSDAIGPMLGVNVIKKGTNEGIDTDMDGSYSLQAKKGDILVFTFMGYETVEKKIGSVAKINVAMKQASNVLNPVVVTASGVKRQKKSLGYAQQTIDNDELITSKQTDISNAMAGKVSGVQLVGAPSSGFNTSSIRMRGDTNVLYVIDGVRTTSTENLNSEDVASLSVLKGAAATALYGPEGKKGVVVITTTKAKKGQSSITFDSGIEVGDATAYFPGMQEEYGGGYSQEFSMHNGEPVVYYSADESWGPKLDGKLVRQWDSWIPSNPNFGKLTPWKFNGGIKNFFRTSLSTKNSVTFKKGGDDYRLKLNLQRNDRNLALPNASRSTNRLGLSFDFDVNKKLNVATNLIYTDMATLNNPTEGYNTLGSNLFQWWQTQLDVKKLRNYRQGGKMVSWNISGPTDIKPKYWDMPYVEVYENLKHDQRHSFIGNVDFTYSLTDHLKARFSAKKTFVSMAQDARRTFELKDPPFYKRSSSRRNRDLYTGSLAYTRKFNKVDFSARLGVEDNTFEYDSFENKSAGGLTIPGYFGIKSSKDRPEITSDVANDKSKAAYGTTSLGYDQWAFFEGSFRRDWSSRAALSKTFVDSKAGSISLVVSKFIPKNDYFTFWKLRGGYSEGAFFPERYATYETYKIAESFSGNSVLSAKKTLANSNLAGAVRTEFEVGTEMRFLKNRISLDVTYFQKQDTNLPVQVNIDPTRGYDAMYSNEGIQTYKGFEVGLSGTPIRNANFSWNTAVNFATLERFVDKVSNSTKTSDTQYLDPRWGGLILRNEEGEKWGRVYGNKIMEHNGKKIIRMVNNDDGTISAPYETKTNQFLGNFLPDFTGGFTNTFKYKGLSLGVDMDFQVGGNFFSTTRMFVNYSGLGIDTVGDNKLGNPLRDPVLDKSGTEKEFVKTSDVGVKSGGVFVEGVTQTGGSVVKDADGNITSDTRTYEPFSMYKSAKKYHHDGFGELSKFLYDASYLSIRNIRLAYTINKDYTKPFGVQDLTIGAYMNNAFLLFESVPGVDPSQIEAATQDNTTSDNASFLEGGQLPSTRTVGVNLRIKF